MLNNQNCTVVSSFIKENKVYVTLELDLFNINNGVLTEKREFKPRDLSIGDFKIDVNSNNGNITISLHYGNLRLAEWSIQVPENACVHLGDQSLDIFGFGASIKNIQVCLNGSDVCFKASAYVDVPIIGDQKIGDIDLCASDVL
ncbi:hypothetical protein QJ133_04210 [Priestia megaterium]|uniref:hypothetical protein n=1 Tax=Priestia megaterium TaxID=1404 RepID=UPI00249C4062|nr:hypothetical protein [Priestia megaterium]MDI3090369.1 hypothetical protein [Priestia megaterium]